MNITQLAPALSRKSLANTWRYGGGFVSILLTGKDTGGAFSLWESVQKPGSEPPLHVHHTTDEIFYILEGKVRFMAGDQILDVGPGDVVYGPRGVPHTFRIKSEYARAITLCTPSGFEEWFQHLGQPATSLPELIGDLPDRVQPMCEADFSKMLALAKKLKIDLLPQPVDL